MSASPPEMLCHPGWPPVDADLWRRLVRQPARSCTDADYARLPAMYQGVIDRKRENERFAELLANPWLITRDDAIAIDRHDAEQARILGIPNDHHRRRLLNEICDHARATLSRVIRERKEAEKK